VDRRTLDELGELGILRVAATGRSLYSALSVLPPDTPIDYLCHSSGAGILRWSDRQALRVVDMPADAAHALARELVQRELDFMLHFRLPDNHHFYAHRTPRENADFDRRAQRFAAFANVLTFPLPEGQPMSHAVVIDPPPGPGRYAEVVSALPGFQVLRSTSPLDGASTWIEIFPLGVNKAAAAAWLWQTGSTQPLSSMAIGNDYNDLALLDWADAAFVVGNAPAELRARYATVASNDDAGFSQAVRRALGEP
jgi:hydroxymethylpyrimidine pyrophosphatase-like HAD family hydrolase